MDSDVDGDGGFELQRGSGVEGSRLWVGEGEIKVVVLGDDGGGEEGGVGGVGEASGRGGGAGRRRCSRQGSQKNGCG